QVCPDVMRRSFRLLIGAARGAGERPTLVDAPPWRWTDARSRGRTAPRHEAPRHERRTPRYFSFAIGLTSTPTPSMSISQVSPAFIHTGFGLRAWPTPEGVPVNTISPGSRVMPCVT